MTQKELLESLLEEISNIKTNMPNGELRAMIKDIDEIKTDISQMKETLLNPENGVVVRMNINTSFRRRMEKATDSYEAQMREIEILSRWKSGVTTALWILFTSVMGVALKLFTM